MEIRYPAKCILAGEHSVLRGGYALACPVNGFQIEMIYKKTNSPLEVNYIGDAGEQSRLSFWVAVEKALEICNKSRSDFNGELNINNQIPIASGLGASAAFCACIAKLFSSFQWIKEDEIFLFAKKLEDIFHGKSSGVDVAAITQKQAIIFSKDKGIEPIDFIFKPNLYISYSGNRGLTSDCIQKVESLFLKKPKEAKETDLKMSDAVELILSSLCKTKSLDQLKQGMDLAYECFLTWGLINANLKEHIQFTKSSGALSAKPTGSGDGGYVLSLWPESKIPDPLIFKALF